MFELTTITDFNKIASYIKERNCEMYALLTEEYKLSFKGMVLSLKNKEGKSIWKTERLHSGLEADYKKNADDLFEALLKDKSGLTEESLELTFEVNNILSELKDVKVTQVNENAYKVDTGKQVIKIFINNNFCYVSTIFKRDKAVVKMSDSVHKYYKGNLKHIINNYIKLSLEENEFINQLLHVNEIFKIDNKINLEYLMNEGKIFKTNIDRFFINNEVKKLKRKVSVLIEKNNSEHKIIILGGFNNGVEISLSSKDYLTFIENFMMAELNEERKF